jgi:hypothetical protein
MGRNMSANRRFATNDAILPIITKFKVLSPAKLIDRLAVDTQSCPNHDSQRGE